MEEFKIGDPVLVRSRKNPVDVWEPRIYLGAKDNTVYLDGGWRPARDDYSFIPFNEKTEDMLGSRMAWEEPWEPKTGELVAVKDKCDDYWRPMVFVEITTDGQYRCGWAEDADIDETVSWDQCEPIYKHFNVHSKPNDK